MNTSARSVVLSFPPSSTNSGTLRCPAVHWPCMHLWRSARSAACRAHLDSGTEELLHSFWQSRGVFDENKRRQLVQIARQVDRSGAKLRCALTLKEVLPRELPITHDYMFDWSCTSCARCMHHTPLNLARLLERLASVQRIIAILGEHI